MSHVLRAARHPRHGMSGCGRHLRASRCRAVGYAVIARRSRAGRASATVRPSAQEGTARAGTRVSLPCEQPLQDAYRGHRLPAWSARSRAAPTPATGERPSGRPARELARSAWTAHQSRASDHRHGSSRAVVTPAGPPAPMTLRALAGLVGRRSFRGMVATPALHDAGPIGRGGLGIGTVPSPGCASSRMLPKRPGASQPRAGAAPAIRAGISRAPVQVRRCSTRRVAARTADAGPRLSPAVARPRASPDHTMRPSTLGPTAPGAAERPGGRLAHRRW